METRITATELARRLSDVLSRVRYAGERFAVERNGELIARIAPVGARRGITLGELATRFGELPMPDEGFGDDLEEIQASQERAPSPWRS